MTKRILILWFRGPYDHAFYSIHNKRNVRTMQAQRKISDFGMICETKLRKNQSLTQVKGHCISCIKKKRSSINYYVAYSNMHWNSYVCFHQNLG